MYIWFESISLWQELGKIPHHHTTPHCTTFYFNPRRAESGFSILVDENNFESPIYKVVLASPGKDGYVDVIISWNFKETGCEALTVVLRQGQVHCTEEDWPIAEFNEEIRQLLPLQDFSGYFIRRGVTCLLVNVCLAVLSRYWMFVEGRSLWWIEIVMLAFILGPSVLYMYKMPINMSATTAIQTLSSVNKPPPFTNVAAMTLVGRENYTDF